MHTRPSGCSFTSPSASVPDPAVGRLADHIGYLLARHWLDRRNRSAKFVQPPPVALRSNTSCGPAPRADQSLSSGDGAHAGR